MLKTSTRLFAAGVLATTLVALNTGAFAHDHTAKSGASCCMKPSATKTNGKAVKPKWNLSAKKVAGCACCAGKATKTKTAKAPASPAKKS